MTMKKEPPHCWRANLMMIQNNFRTSTLFLNLKSLLPGLALLFLATACVGIPDESRRLQTKDVTLEYHDKQNDRDIDSIDLQHPFSISQEAMETQVLSIYFEHMALVSSKRPVFNKVQLPNLSRLLTRALNNAKPNHYISFKVTGDGGDTTGDLFAVNGKLHWRVTRINGEAFTSKAWARNVQHWRLAPRTGQKFYVKKIMLEREIHNWLISSLDLSNARSTKYKKHKAKIKKRQSANTPQTIPPATNKEQELERKLGILNKLKSKGLIDPAEFERRRKALLDKYL